MLESILDLLNCKKCIKEEDTSEIIINNKIILNKEIKDENKDEEDLEFENENEKNMEFIQNIQKEIDKENLKLKNELNDIQKEKNTLEENFYKSGDILKKKEEEEE